MVCVMSLCPNIVPCYDYHGDTGGLSSLLRLSELVRDLTVKTLVESAVLLCGLESACTEWI